MGVVPLSTVSPSTPILDLQGLDKSSNTVIEKKPAKYQSERSPHSPYPSLEKLNSG